MKKSLFVLVMFIYLMNTVYCQDVSVTYGNPPNFDLVKDKERGKELKNNFKKMKYVGFGGFEEDNTFIVYKEPFPVLQYAFDAETLAFLNGFSQNCLCPKFDKNGSFSYLGNKIEKVGQPKKYLSEVLYYKDDIPTTISGSEYYANKKRFLRYFILVESSDYNFIIRYSGKEETIINIYTKDYQFVKQRIINKYIAVPNNCDNNTSFMLSVKDININYVLGKPQNLIYDNENDILHRITFDSKEISKVSYDFKTNKESVNNYDLVKNGFVTQQLYFRGTVPPKIAITQNDNDEIIIVGFVYDNDEASSGKYGNQTGKLIYKKLSYPDLKETASDEIRIDGEKFKNLEDFLNEPMGVLSYISVDFSGKDGFLSLDYYRSSSTKDASGKTAYFSFNSSKLGFFIKDDKIHPPKNLYGNSVSSGLLKETLKISIGDKNYKFQKKGQDVDIYKVTDSEELIHTFKANSSFNLYNQIIIENGIIFITEDGLIKVMIE